MKNIPVYMACAGTASLVLQEIPHRKTAYIMLHTVFPDGLSSLLEETAAFCRSCGAETCLVSPADSGAVPSAPRACDVYELTAEKSRLPAPEHPFHLEPISPDNDSIFQRIYNLCFKDVTLALTYDRAQIARIYRSGQKGFLALSDDSVPCGIGEIHGNELAAVGLLPEYRGQGRRLVLSLLQNCPGPEIRLTVASDNDRALRLYEHLGFRQTGIESSWYRI